jgi:plasmid rolling circle replication initiator protein Rep
MQKTKTLISPHSLDTLELTSDYFITKSHETLYHSTLRKGATISTLLQLIDVSDKDWNKKYWKTYHCKNVLLQDGEKFTGSLCRKRWCQNCNRIKTAELIKGYSAPLQELQKADDLYFVTLTTKTVKAGKLSAEITKRYKAFTRIKDNLRKNYGISLVGARKLEVTYNETTNEYHPHFHFIQQGKREAELLQNLWLQQFPNASEKAQDIRLIDANNTDNLVEVFKYATKQTAKDKTSAKALHNIYHAIDGRRTFQTYGKLKKIVEPKEESAEVTNADFVAPRKEIWIYSNELIDYTSFDNEILIGTKEIQQKIFELDSN